MSFDELGRNYFISSHRAYSIVTWRRDAIINHGEPTVLQANFSSLFHITAAASSQGAAGSHDSTKAPDWWRTRSHPTLPAARIHRRLKVLIWWKQPASFVLCLVPQFTGNCSSESVRGFEWHGVLLSVEAPLDHATITSRRCSGLLPWHLSACACDYTSYQTWSWDDFMLNVIGRTCKQWKTHLHRSSRKTRRVSGKLLNRNLLRTSHSQEVG
jgi:hypothetical protein